MIFFKVRSTAKERRYRVGGPQLKYRNSYEDVSSSFFRAELRVDDLRQEAKGKYKGRKVRPGAKMLRRGYVISWR